MEVTEKETQTLNQKLVLAIERQAELEDQVAAARDALTQARRQIDSLEREQRDTKERLAAGLLVSKAQLDQETQDLQSSVQAAEQGKEEAEAAKTRMEKEVEDLTRSLFEEANKLVVVSRKETQAVLERNEKLVQQLEEKDTLLASHQQQLEELKTVLQRLSVDDDRAAGSRPGSPRPNPSRHAARHSRDLSLGGKTSAQGPPLTQGQGSPLTPHFATSVASPQMTSGLGLLPSAIPADEYLTETRQDAAEANTDAIANTSLEAQDGATATEQETPSDPTSEGPDDAIVPVYRTDTTAFYEFRALLPKQTTPKRSLDRPRSGAATPASTASPVQTAASYWGRSTDEKKEKDRDLQSTKFWKRILVEDIEPTLRLDQAPDLGYLGRRTFLQAVSEGHLLVEPHPAQLARFRPERQACALCGDHRQDAGYARRFRCRTGETESAAIYPLCDWCLDRVRAVCGLVAFLRQVRDGLWKGEEEEEVLMRCWEEGVKLRETTFWARVGHRIAY